MCTHTPTLIQIGHHLHPLIGQWTLRLSPCCGGCEQPTASVGFGRLLGTASLFPAAVSPEGGSPAHMEAPPRCSPSQPHQCFSVLLVLLHCRGHQPDLICTVTPGSRASSPGQRVLSVTCPLPQSVCVRRLSHVHSPSQVSVHQLSRVCPPAVTCPLPQSGVCLPAVTCMSVGCHVSTPPVRWCVCRLSCVHFPSQVCVHWLSRVSTSCHIHDSCRRLWPRHFPEPARLSTWGEKLNPESAPSAP